MPITSAIQLDGSPGTSSRPIDSRPSAPVAGRKAIPSNNARWRGGAPRAASNLASGLPLQAYRQSIYRLAQKLIAEDVFEWLSMELI